MISRRIKTAARSSMLAIALLALVGERTGYPPEMLELDLDLAREHRPFLTGITVSGGEPTQQLDFIIDP